MGRAGGTGHAGHFKFLLHPITTFFGTAGKQSLGWPLPGFFHDPGNVFVVAFLQFLLTLPILYLNDKYYKVGIRTLLQAPGRAERPRIPRTPRRR